MTQETFEVMISEQEYKELKKNKEKNLELMLFNKNLEKKLKHAEQESEDAKKAMAKKDMEIGFLVETILNFSNGRGGEGQYDISVLKSNAFQILGQSVVEPEKAQERRKAVFHQQFSKKYTNLLKMIITLEERMQSQEELINKLNQMNTQNNEALIRKQLVESPEDKAKRAKIQQEHSNMNKQINILQIEINELKKKNSQQKLQLEGKASTIEKNSDKLINQIQKETQNLKSQNKSLQQKTRDCNERIKDLEMENAVLKQGLGNSTFAKEQTKDKIKGLVDEYVREVERNLKLIEGLNVRQVRDLVQHEMKDLSDYITKVISRKK